MANPRAPKTIVFGILFCLTLSAVAAKPSAELNRAIAAAAKARSTPKGASYQQAAMVVFGKVIGAAIKDCGIRNAPGARSPSGFQAVLIIASSGKLKWIIRDPSNPLSNCFLSKTAGMTFPPPPSDNWPVLFQIN
jgi:hypothetical protein